MADLDDAVTQRARAKVGQVLRGKWRLDRLLGVGGMACVYAATHRNGKRGAVKMLHAELSVHEDAKTRFLREGYVANKVDHPGAVSVLDDDVAEDGAVFLVMELLEGESVDARLSKRPGERLPVPEVLAVADQLLDVLAAAHDKGIVHRDLKPENLFLTTQEQLKVLDFGIARLRELSSTSQATKTGSVMGTPAFMPPEQALGNWSAVDGRTDLWATGATMFRMLTGRAVHEADTINKLLLAAMTKPAPPIQSFTPALPPALAAIVDRALRFEQSERWPDARSMQQALRDFAGQAAMGAAHASLLGSASGFGGPPSSAVPSSGQPGGMAAGSASAPMLAAPAMSLPSASLVTTSLGSIGSPPPAATSSRGLVIGGLVTAVVAIGGLVGFVALRRAPATQPAAAESVSLAPTAAPDAPPSSAPSDAQASASATAAAPASASAAATPTATAAAAKVAVSTKVPARPPGASPGTPAPQPKKDPFNKW